MQTIHGAAPGKLLAHIAPWTYYLAVFNLSEDVGVSKQVPLERVDKVFAGGKPASVTDVWTDSPLGSATGTLGIPWVLPNPNCLDWSLCAPLCLARKALSSDKIKILCLGPTDGQQR